MKMCYICKGKFESKHVKDTNYRKVDHWNYAAHSICNLKYSVPKLK